MPRKKLSTLVQEELRFGILNGPYTVGSYLPSENELCHKYDVSRTTIRDAISGLVEQGFVERQQGKGVLVIDNSEQVIREAFRNKTIMGNWSADDFYEARGILERELAALAAERMTENEIEEAKRTISRMLDADLPLALYIEADAAFHRLLSRGAHNAVMDALYMAILPLQEEIMAKVIHTGGRAELTYGYHGKILEAIERRDESGAMAAVDAHNDAGRQMLRDAGDSVSALMNRVLANDKRESTDG